MASPTSAFTTFTELVTTTYRNHKKEVADNISNHNALFRRLTQKGRVRREDGGLSIVEPLEYAENSTYTRYSGFDPLNVEAVDVLTSAEYQWCQVSVNVAASGLEIRSNAGENRIVNLVKTKIKNAQKSMANGLAQDLYSDGSASNQLGGLQKIIADSGSSTVGGIATSSYSWWANVVQTAATPLQGGSGITPGSTTIESLMLPLYLRLTRGADHPDLIVMDEAYYTFFEQSQSSLKRYAPEDDGQAGMVAMKYKNADVFHDSSASGIADDHGYFLNTDYLSLVTHVDADMEIMPELRAVNQDAIVIPVIWQGALTCSNRALQGVVKA